MTRGIVRQHVVPVVLGLCMLGASLWALWQTEKRHAQTRVAYVESMQHYQDATALYAKATQLFTETRDLQAEMKAGCAEAQPSSAPQKPLRPGLIPALQHGPGSWKAGTWECPPGTSMVLEGGGASVAGCEVHSERGRQ